ncbi:MAG: O-antigen ligase family protein [Bacteroidales bacterium]|nr:O-antigen ligase family protein [Bacteroidales bacterium]
MGLFVFLCIALVYSYARAAWLSIMVAAAILFILLFRIRFSVVLLLSIIIGSVIYINFDQIIQRLERTSEESSANFTEHLVSMSNVTTDIYEPGIALTVGILLSGCSGKPVFGWGPGTYMFQYAPFQIVSEKTEISTNDGSRGNAHSEYLGPLSESGLLGMITFILIVLTTSYIGIRVYANAVNRQMRIIAASVFLGLVTYYVHGVMNNFLDTDKASALFWSFTVILVVIDVNYTERKSKQLNT